MKLCALIMAGGKGTRLEADTEKPLLKLENKFLIDYALEAVSGCKHIDRLWAVTSPHTPETEKYLKEKDVQILQSPGDGYVEDLVFAIGELGLGKTLTITADLPLLESIDLEWAIEEYQKQEHPALAVIVSQDNAPAGMNIVDGKNLNGSEFKM
jgi:adenosylcobinamide-phosphate guanylyltransferase